MVLTIVLPWIIGKDLEEMSQEKAIQAMGRVGRNKLQFQYSMRFRDNDIICKLSNTMIISQR